MVKADEGGAAFNVNVRCQFESGTLGAFFFSFQGGLFVEKAKDIFERILGAVIAPPLMFAMGIAIALDILVSGDCCEIHLKWTPEKGRR